MNHTKITVLEKGPYLVEGTYMIINSDGQEEIRAEKTALCSCGLSAGKPYCDGSHRTPVSNK